MNTRFLGNISVKFLGNYFVVQAILILKWSNIITEDRCIKKGLKMTLLHIANIGNPDIIIINYQVSMKAATALGNWVLAAMLGNWY